MQIIINHDAKTNGEIIGADMLVVQFKTQQIMDKVIAHKYKKMSEMFVDILGDIHTNDAEKLVIFMSVNKIMDNSIIVIQLPKGGI